MKPAPTLLPLRVLCALRVSLAASLLAAGSALMTTAHAQSTPAAAPVTKLEKFEVTAKPDQALTLPSLEAARRELARAAGSVAVTDSAEYRTGRTSTLKDALDFAPGVVAQPRFGAEESRLSIRGSGLQRTFHGRGLLLMQDGVPLNLADGGFDFQAVEPLTARYIEVYRGANALRYGATTLGGAINYASPTGRDASAASLRAEAGSFGYQRALASSGGVNGSADYYVGATYFAQDGYRDWSEQKTTRLFGNVGWRPQANLETRFYLGYTDTDSQIPGELTPAEFAANPRQAARNPFFAPADHVTSKWKRDFTWLRLSNQTTAVLSPDARLTASAFSAHKRLDHPIIIVIDQATDDYGAELRYESRADLAGSANQFTLGLSATRGTTDDNRFPNQLGARGPLVYARDQKASNLSLYAEDQFSLNPQLALVAGAQAVYANRETQERIPTTQRDDQTFRGFNPKLGLRYDLDATTQLFANISGSFEPPSFGEITNFGLFGEPTGAGTRKLDAQRATSIEIGTRGRNGRASWDLAAYHAWVRKELISYAVAPGATATLNAGDTLHTGFEARLDLELARGLLTGSGDAAKSDTLTLRQNYLWSYFRFDGDRTYGNHRLAGLPEHVYRADLRYAHPSGFSLSPGIEWVPRAYALDFKNTLFAPGYTLLNLRAGWQIARRWNVFVDARNLTDRRYVATASILPDASAPGADLHLLWPGDGRAVYFGVEFKW